MFRNCVDTHWVDEAFKRVTLVANKQKMTTCCENFVNYSNQNLRQGAEIGVRISPARFVK